MAARRKSLIKVNKASKAMVKTFEPLDLCFEKGIINERELKAGIKLRHLYLQRYGNPLIKSNFPKELNIGSTYVSEDNGSDTYKILMEKLEKNELRDILINVCVHLKKPRFLGNGYNNLPDLELFKSAIKTISDHLIPKGTMRQN